ncbi:hypothetical protein GA830_17420 [Mesorhizobium sp. NBSH29]|uniref:hypothetical protein n=1 Tax=Mesorhizobium sp. NBSH29 TaxID=2654249 RepID=UPI0018969AE2|nr:hypothetical protein [Mesorhizobium sp. NBSH29]QPC88338.1 hypothetical protein GA830_17420 [Mesorhizobium sp. NBSH29]
MDTRSQHPAHILTSALERPAFTLMIVCQMLVGLGLAFALVLKVYMLIFTNQVCVADGTTLGNMIRCAQTLELMAQFLILVAGFRFAALMFTMEPYQLLGSLLLALTGVFLLFLSELSIATATWYFSLIILVLFGAISGVFIALRIWGASDRVQESGADPKK